MRPSLPARVAALGAAPALAVALTASLAAVPAAASTGWDGGTFAYPDGTLPEFMTRMVVDDDGDRYVVFRDSEFSVKLVVIPAEGQPEPPVTVFSSSEVSGILPDVAVDSDDRALVVWQGNGEGPAKVMARTVDGDGVLGDVLTLSGDGGGSAYAPSVVADAAGTATVVWPVDGGTGVADDRLEMRRVDLTGDEPLAPLVELDAPTGAAPDFAGIRNPGVGVDPQGRVTVAWVRAAGTPDGERTIRAVRIGADGTVGETRLVSAPATTYVDFPEVAIAPDGAATVAWTAFRSEYQTWANRLAAADGMPGTPVRVSDPDTDSADDPAITMDPQGRATIVWQAYGATNTLSLFTRRMAADGSLEAARPALGQLAGTLPRFDMYAAAADSDGRVTVAWPGIDAGSARMHAVRLDAEGEPSTTRRLGRRSGSNEWGEFVEVGVDDLGRVSVAWTLGAVRVRRSLPPAAPVPAETTILSGPDEGAVVADQTPTFEVEGDTLQSTVECRVDGAAVWSPCTSAYTTPVLANGPHTFEARATDADGSGPDPTPAVRTFTVNYTPPPPGPSAACVKARKDLTRAKQRVQRIKKSQLPPRVKRAKLKAAQKKVVRAKQVVRREC